MPERKFATILGIYGKPADRFMGVGYKASAPDLYERLKIAGQQDLIRGVELIEGQDDDVNRQNYKQVRQAVQDNGLVVCSLNPNLWGERQWGRGSLGSRKAAIRQQAIERVKAAMDLAAELDCPAVGIWPGQDGYDYVFEEDYEQMYDRWVSAVQECADYNPAIKLALEYKPYEPRTHSTIDTAPKTLLMINDIERPNVGMVLDVGHALVQHENLGDVVHLAQRRKKLFHLHLNDNYADWDWDMNFASVRLFEFIEMLYWLKRTGYDGWYSIDIFAYRTDGPASVYESLAWLEALLSFVEQNGPQTFTGLIEQNNPIATSQFFRRALFK
jgi:sugar phosphate isomerase/epimerase